MKLLVPTDFSHNAQKAIDYALNIASENSEIILLHAYQIIETDSAIRKYLFEEYNLSIARKLQSEMKALKRKITKVKPGIDVVAELYDNDIENSIVAASERFGVDLIVMGTQGATGLKKAFMGSVTAKVIGNAHVPVLAIPRLYKWRVPRNILLATNRFETDASILDIVFNMVDIFKAHLHVIVFTDTDTAGAEEFLNHKNKLDEYRIELGKRHEISGISSSHLKGSEFEDALQHCIDENSIDIIVMVTYQRNLLESIFNRSATKEMAYRASIPLLAIPVRDI